MLPAILREAALRPRNVHVQYVLGQTYLTLGRYADAESTFREAVRLAFRDASCQYALGWTLLAEQRLPDALPYLRGAVLRDSTYGDAWRLLAETYVRLDSISQAKSAYVHAVRTNPLSAQVAYEYATVLSRFGNDRGALGQMRRALHLDSANVDMQRFSGYLFRTQGQFAESKAHLLTARKLAPRNAGVWAELGATDYLMGDRADAATEFATSRRIDSTYIGRNPALLKIERSVRTGGKP
jgi:tetratricopeptide (TPR) repeat protein